MDTPTTYKCPRCQQNTLLDLRDTPFDIDNGPTDVVCKTCQQDRLQCHDCPKVQDGPRCYFYNNIPLAVRIAVPSKTRKLLRTAQCRLEFTDSPKWYESGLPSTPYNGPNGVKDATSPTK